MSTIDTVTEEKRRRAPAQRPGTSRQDYETPLDFITAVERRFGKLDVDLAASHGQQKASDYVAPEQDSLAVDWAPLVAGKTAWLNPPFGRIEPWAAKCAATVARAPKRGKARTRILLLTPASIGAAWFCDHVHDKALVLFLRGRLSFDGIAPYPKDCILSVFGAAPGYEVWAW